MASKRQTCLIRAKPTHSSSSCWRSERTSPSCQLAARFASLCKTRAPSGPIPPHVPNDIARKPQPAALQGASYLECFANSFFFRNVLHRSLLTENRSEDCQPCTMVRSRAVGAPFWKEVSRISAGRNSPSGQSGIFASQVKPWPEACRRLASASWTALCLREKLFLAQHDRWCRTGHML